MAENDDTPKRRASKAPRGGRYTRLLEKPKPIPWNDGGAEAFFEYLDNLKAPADALAEMLDECERQANQVIAYGGLPDEGPAKHWAHEMLREVGVCRRLYDHPHLLALAASDLGFSRAMVQVYVPDEAAHAGAAKAGTKAKVARADERMADLRAAMARVPYAERGSASKCRKALERKGWVSPWTPRVTEARIREVLRKPASKTRDSVHVPGGKV